MSKKNNFVMYIKINKVKNGYKPDGFPKEFKTIKELKIYFERTSAWKVKFIKNY